MIDYRAGYWGIHVAFGIQGSLAPRALVMAIPNALLTLLISTMLLQEEPDSTLLSQDTVDAAQIVIAAVTPIMIFILYNRSRTSYDRWWEGGTLLQKTRGEWFNAYSSIMAFCTTKPELQDQVDAYVHLLTRLMSLLMCCGLQQVSPDRDRPFEIFDLAGIEPASMEFLNAAPDKVEIILQWIQRSMVLHQQTGVLPVAPPILSRAFQEVSRGIVNLQNARKIADFPYPYPLAQISMILQLIHWAATPIAGALALPRGWAVLFSFCSIFVLWCIHFNALDLEFPFGSRVNDLPMQEFQQEWNNSIRTLVAKRATRPPKFDYDPVFHDALSMVMSDASELYVPKNDTRNFNRRKIAVIRVGGTKAKTSLLTKSGEKGVKGVPKGGEKTANVQGSQGAPAAETNSAGKPPDKIVASPNATGNSEPVKGNSEPVKGNSEPGKESSVSQSNESTTQHKVEAANDTGASAAQSSRSSRNRPPNTNSLNTGAVLTPVGLSLEPLVLDTAASPTVASPTPTSDVQSNIRQTQESGSQENASPKPPPESVVPI